MIQIIAVICTFSFGSAFAAQTVTYNAQESKDKLYTVDAFVVNEASETNGAYGITEAYRAELVDEWTDILNGDSTSQYNVEYANYCPAEEEAAKAAITSAIETFKAATTAKAAYQAEVTLVGKLAKLKRVVLPEASMTNIYNTVNVGMGSVLGGSASVYFLEGYGFFTGLDADVATLTNAGVKINATTTDSAKAMWFYDNGYRTAASAKAHVADFQKALVVLDDDVIAALQKEYNAINAKAKAAKAAYTAAGSYVAASVDGISLEAIEAIYAEEKAYADKVGNIASATSLHVYASFETFGNTLDVLEYAYEHQYDAEVKAVDLTNKDAVVALQDKLDDMGEEFVYVTNAFYGNRTFNAPDTAPYAALKKAYDDFKAADEDAYNDVKNKFEEISIGNGYYFDSSEENVASLKAARAAYDELNKYYDYTDINEEAKLLAAEHNMKAAAGYDEKDSKIDNSKVVAYLNNATVTVKSTKLAAKKVRVQAKVDTQAMGQIIEALGNGGTVEYKFYHKAPGKSFKLTKTKSVNYITYTSKSLKKGKNSFRVGIVIKDADGNVVATKDYQASSLAYRTIK